MADHYGQEPGTTDNKWSKNGFGHAVSSTGGKFSKDESETVRRAVEDYCATKQITTARLCSECDHKSELKGAWMEIAKRLPHRTVQSVYRHGLRQLHPFKRGPWTDDEQRQLVDLVNRMGKKWSAIQAKLNRSADSCRDKHREMSNEYVKGRWKDEETEVLKRHIRDHLRVDPSADIKELGKMVEREGITIPWSVISKRMAKRSRLSCFKKWQKMTGLYSPSDVHKIPLPNADIGSTSVSAGGIPQTITEGKPETMVVPQGAGHMTAGAAAARAAAAAAVEQKMEFVQRPGAAVPATLVQAEKAPDVDFVLLSEIAASGAVRESEVAWNNLQNLEGNASLRWRELIDEWRYEESPNENMLTLPLYQIAHILLERKQQAKMAAETVEAVDLPTLKTADSVGDA